MGLYVYGMGFGLGVRFQLSTSPSKSSCQLDLEGLVDNFIQGRIIEGGYFLFFGGV